MPKVFNVYSEVTKWHGEDCDDYSQESQSEGQGLGLRQAIEALRETRTAHCGGVEAVEASSSDMKEARWVDLYNGPEFLTGAHERRSIHWPDSTTPSTRQRLCRLIINWS